LQPSQLGILDRGIAKQDARLTRPKAIRALVAAGLKAKGK